MKPRGYLINGNFYDENISDSELDLVTPLYLEEPQTKPLSDEPSVKEITDLWIDVINNRPANDKRPIAWHFANALLAKVRGEK